MRCSIVSVALFAAVASCDKAAVVGPLDGPAATVTVHGQVSRADGVGIPSVAMAIEARAQGSCAGPSMDATTVSTDDSGRYRATLFNWGSEYTVCVNVHAVPANGSGFKGDSLQRFPVIMRSENPDSIRLDVMLQPGA